MKLDLSLNGRTQATFVGFRGRDRASAFFKRGRDMEYIRRGMEFRRTKRENVVETARVLSVVLDRTRIPHIRYEVNIHHAGHDNGFVDGPRMLALSVFTDTYSERVGSAKRR